MNPNIVKWLSWFSCISSTWITVKLGSIPAYDTLSLALCNFLLFDFYPANAKPSSLLKWQYAPILMYPLPLTPSGQMTMKMMTTAMPNDLPPPLWVLAEHFLQACGCIMSSKDTGILSASDGLWEVWLRDVIDKIISSRTPGWMAALIHEHFLQVLACGCTISKWQASGRMRWSR